MGAAVKSPGDAMFACPTRAEFWDVAGPRVLLPPAGPVPALRAMDWARLGLPEDAVVFTSSGTTGHPKWTVLTRAGLLASARQVVDWLGLEQRDHFYCPLPLYHVGGFGMVVRARLVGAALTLDRSKWDAGRFAADVAAARASVTSLVPAQVFDIVKARLPCPASLRIVVVGGGQISPAIDSEARQLGWPILASFGMTETGSQIATEKPGLPGPGPGWLPVIDGWEVSLGGCGCLRLRGPGMFAGRVVEADGCWRFEPAEFKNGWFESCDFAQVEERDGRSWVRPMGRSDDSIKIRGELISLSAAEREMEGLARGHGLDPRQLAVIDIEDGRTGRRLVLAGEPGVADRLEELRDAFNHRAPAFARIEGIHLLEAIPRSPLGKLQRMRLREVIENLPRD